MKKIVILGMLMLLLVGCDGSIIGSDKFCIGPSTVVVTYEGNNTTINNPQPIQVNIGPCGDN